MLDIISISVCLIGLFVALVSRDQWNNAWSNIIIVKELLFSFFYIYILCALMQVAVITLQKFEIFAVFKWECIKVLVLLTSPAWFHFIPR